MSSFANKMLCLFLVLGLASPSMATQYDVGGLLGWNLGVDLNIWFTGKTFHVGDVLRFKFNPLLHNVVQLVDSVAYTKCDASVKLWIDTSGDVLFVLNKVGDFYFCSSLITDCLLNLKIKISVVA